MAHKFLSITEGGLGVPSIYKRFVDQIYRATAHTPQLARVCGHMPRNNCRAYRPARSLRGRCASIRQPKT